MVLYNLDFNLSCAFVVHVYSVQRLEIDGVDVLKS